MTEVLRDATERLRAGGIEAPRAEARILWEHARKDSARLYDLVQRRLAHEPIAYITGHKEFWSLDFEIGPGVLVPRPETETLVEEAICALPDRSAAYRFLDLGTGSGCLLIALLSEFPKASGVGVDCSSVALEFARRNAGRHGVSTRCEFTSGNWEAAEGLFDLIVSNPPYIVASDLPVLPADILEYEPALALDGGADGLNAYRAIAPVLANHLAPSGFALLEVGAGQHHLASDIVEASGLIVASTKADLAGLTRCLLIRRTTQ